MSILFLTLALGSAAPEPREITWPDPTARGGASTAPETLSERCDGTRSRPLAEATCTRWKIEWSKDGKVWGVTTADSREALVAKRERLLGHARQYARLFELALDDRWSDPTVPICDTCEQNALTAVAGTPPPDAVTAALIETRARLVAFEQEVLDVHAPRLRDIARLAHDPATARLGKAYAKALELAIVDVVHLALELDNAVVFRAKADVERARKAIEARRTALDRAASALVAVVAKAAAKAHAGTYDDDAVSGPGAARLMIDISPTKVIATFAQGEASAVWFEGTVQLDGTLSGRTLVAPEGGTLTCSNYSLDCGYVWAPAQLRFEDRTDARGKRHTVELWFEQSKWLHARPFSR